MNSVGVRELRQRASDLLRLVAQGQTIQITDRGQPVALLTPIEAEVGPLERLRRAGLVQPATGSLDHLPDPLPAGNSEKPSAVLERQRAERL